MTALPEPTRRAPLCVLLEGGLVPNDLKVEARLARLGRRAVAFHPSELPYHPDILTALSVARSEGRRTVLVAMSSHEEAEMIADHLGFDEILTAAAYTSRELTKTVRLRFPGGEVDLLADDRTLAKLGAMDDVVPVPVSGPKSSRWRSVIPALRVHQWLKNVLIFLPVIAGHRYTEGSVVLHAVLAFFAFSFTASSIYVVNDVLDLRSDRSHPSKRFRPFASGSLPLTSAPLLSLVALFGGFLLAAATLPWEFSAVLAAYLILTSAYTTRLKGAVLLDVLTLAVLYTLRVFAGCAATGIKPSVWLIGFLLFFCLSLAMLKRYAELHRTMEPAETAEVRQLPGRGYQFRDLPVLIATGVGTGCMAVLILALYVISDEFARHYTYPWLLWLLCPLALYWIGRAWIVVARDEMDDDPLIWAVKDTLSRWVGGQAILILILAK